MSRVATVARRTTVEELEQAFKALADSTRLRILALLGNNEVCVCHLHDSLGLPQPTVSRHLAYLRRTGLMSARREDRKSTRLNSSHGYISYAVFCLKKKKKNRSI